MAHQTAVFAAGCFWGVEERFRRRDGVIEATSGYTGGHVDQPTYKQVCTGETGHAEAVEVLYDDEQVSYAELLETFFALHNPTTLNRQGPDVGSQYRSAIFVASEAEEQAARAAIEAANASGRWSSPVVTAIEPAAAFWKAEDYHQRYLEKNGQGLCAI